MDRLRRVPEEGPSSRRRLSQQGRSASEAPLPGSIEPRGGPAAHPPFAPIPLEVLRPPAHLSAPAAAGRTEKERDGRKKAKDSRGIERGRETKDSRKPAFGMSSSTSGAAPPRGPRRTASGARSTLPDAEGGGGGGGRREVGRTASLTHRRPTLSGTFGRTGNDEPNRVVRPSDREFSREKAYRANE